MVRLAALFVIIFLPFNVFAKEEPGIDLKNEAPLELEKEVLILTDPHKLGDEGCHYCHVKGEEKQGVLLKSIKSLCRDCHKQSDEHKTDPFPFTEYELQGKLKEKGVFAGLEGMDCLTCHDAHAKSPREFYLEEAVYNLFMETKRINPHWKKGVCIACHSTDPEIDHDKFKFGGNLEKTCNNCHAYISNEMYIHAVGMRPSTKILRRMPDDFRLTSEGKVSCITCHEIKYQCLKEESHRKKNNPLFFRGGPYFKRTDLCYKCHSREQQGRLNPHDQINDEGELVVDRCLYCHLDLPDPQRDKDISQVKFVVDNLKDLCQRCHRDRPHPGGKWINFDHLVPPPGIIRFWMKHTEKTKDVVLPLEPDTEIIFCCTCHNPHEKGVLRGRFDRGADNDRRLRLNAGMEICKACHGDK